MLALTSDVGPAMVSAEWEQCQASANEFFTKGLAKSTQKSYQSGIRRYESFCARLNRPTLPAREETVSVFVAALAKEGVSHTSLKVYLAAVRHYQIQNGQGDPGMSQRVRLEYIRIRRDGTLKR
ncbi:MAG: site-specific integrase [Proteobacteria bacterium]|nr:site-specific integrase [Pseudomonadota bacterium]